MRSKTKILIAILFIVLVLGAVYTWFQYRQSDTESGSGGTINSVDYGPPTEEEKQSGDKIKDKVIEDQKRDDQSQNKPANNATVIITDAGQYENIIEVRSFISDVYKDGTCTITLSQGSLEVKKEAPAYKDASTTICTNPLINRSELNSTGTWQVTVAYRSTDGSANGISNSKAIVIK